MSVTPTSTIVGVFSDEATAEQAVNALYNAGFRQEEIQYLVPRTPGSFFEGLKNFLSGTNDGGANLAGDLTSMGLADDEVRNYADEYNNGHPVLIVRTAEHGTEAMNVLRQYGAYNTQTEATSSGEAAGDIHQPTAYTQSDISTADTRPSSDNAQQSSYGAPGQYDNIQNVEAQPQAQTGEEHPYAAAQAGNATPEYDLSDQDTRIITPQNDTYAQDMDTQARDMQADTTTPAPDSNTDTSASATDTTMRGQDSETPTTPLPSAAPQEYGLYQDARASGTGSETDMRDQQGDALTTADYQTTQVDETTSETDTYEQSVQATPDTFETTSVYAQTDMAAPETMTGAQPTQADTTTPEQDAGSQTEQTTAPAMTGFDAQPQQSMQTTPVTASQATEMQPALASAASPEQMDELQQLQAQLQTLQQQLQEAKARLAEAKEQENQMRTAREREQQLQAARQQLQDAQAELQATLAEYQEVQSHMAHYQ